jgi:cyanophycinase
MESSGHILAIGGAEDRVRGSELLQAFAELAGGACARIVLITTASGIPSRSFAEYCAAFNRLGVPVVRELRPASPEDAHDERTLAALTWATGVFFSGGDQSRLQVLVGSSASRSLRDRLIGNKLVIAGTSAGATVMGTTMILGGGCRAAGNDTAGERVRTGPGLSLLPEVIVDMHFAERKRFPRLLEAVLRQPSHLGVGIDEDTAILASAGRFDVLGRGAVVAVDARATAATCAARGRNDIASFDVRVHRLYAGDAFDMKRRRTTSTSRTGQGPAVHRYGGLPDLS